VTPEETAPSSDVQPTGRPNARMRQTIGDMVRSMAVVLGVVAVIVLFTLRPQPDPVKVVDAAPVVALAAAQASFPIGVPTSLPEGWRSTSARWEPTEASGEAPVLHVGYVTPSDQYAQVTQSTASSDRYVAEQTGDGIATGNKDIGGTVWQTRERKATRSLVRSTGGVETIVSGSAPWEELAILAASLQPAAS
jgi:hypothetical protein